MPDFLALAWFSAAFFNQTVGIGPPYGSLMCVPSLRAMLLTTKITSLTPLSDGSRILQLSFFPVSYGFQHRCDIGCDFTREYLCIMRVCSVRKHETAFT